jgi:L-lactate dehydrogenase complex protein LldE
MLEARVLVSLFVACYNDLLFPATGRAVVKVLERLGHTVEFRSAQTCCGQMHYNTGYILESRPLLRRFVEIFGDAENICVPSSSCVAMIRDHYPKLAREMNDSELVADVDQLVPRVYEFTEFLVNRLGVEDVGAYYPHSVTYHPSCHSLRGLKLGDVPYRLLQRVRSLQLIDLPEKQECCGFGGTFSVKNADTSQAMLTDKVRTILDTGAELCVAADNSCLMHIFGALHRGRTGVRTAHIAEVLASTEGEPFV